MAKNKKSRFEDWAKSSVLPERKAGVRSERPVAEETTLLTLNFKDFDFAQCPPGQTLAEWERKAWLSKLMEKFIQISSKTYAEATQEKMLKIYGAFPVHSHFKFPAHIHGDVRWGTIQRIGGQKPRLAGYIIGSTFYPVFLDMEHRFYPSEKK